ncbi:hypothetical protein E4U17_002075 [Claviceps sp. LM77 group G4]|nr:hypothetical protein E4U33_008136 [Claviceps sp. LM78 group G4]KAG6056602.1 hypothetical protein E4U17_002075 [Claviceps sp. LM77 group G4]KAG6076879.1 hypothetical protein E4U16_002538 [Claviceps sp. LM84 group G4]
MPAVAEHGFDSRIRLCVFERDLNNPSSSQEFLYENDQVISHKPGRLSLAVGKARLETGVAKFGAEALVKNMRRI